MLIILINLKTKVRDFKIDSVISSHQQQILPHNINNENLNIKSDLKVIQRDQNLFL